jgi:hypothetical protein
MSITLTCPSCGKQCAVKEEHAGTQVRCPNCPAVITVPAAGAAAPVLLEPEAVPVTSPPPMPGAPGGAAFLDKVNAFLAANGVGGINRILLFVGVGCLAFFLITLFLPWTPSFRGVSGDIPGFGKVELAGPSVGGLFGIQLPQGLLYFFLTLGVTFLLVFVVLMEWSSLFAYSLWTASNYSILVALHLLVEVRVAGWGKIISLLVMLAAAATLGIVAFSKAFTKTK